MYAETLCGVAQIVRDPAILPRMDLTARDKYYSMPSPFGAYIYNHDFEKLPRPNADEMALIMKVPVAASMVGKG